MIEHSSRLARRDVLKFIAAAAILPGTTISTAFAQQPQVVTKGYGTDPDLTKEHKIGDVWPLLMSKVELATTMSMVDVLLPADDLGPAASSLRVHDYVNEWISAPYPAQVDDRASVQKGLAWLEAESQKRFTASFTSIKPEQKEQICRDICWPAEAKEEFREAAYFFVKIRSIAMGAYYGTVEGWKAIGYIGNVPTVNFDGPPAALLQKLGLEQTVK